MKIWDRVPNKFDLFILGISQLYILIKVLLSKDAIFHHSKLLKKITVHPPYGKKIKTDRVGDLITLFNLLEPEPYVKEIMEECPGLFIDIGANRLRLSLFYLQLDPGNRVLAFEPNPYLLPINYRLIENEGLGNRLTLVGKALGPDEGETDFYMPSRFSGNSSLDRTTEEENRKRSKGEGFANKIKMTSLDKTLSTFGVSPKKVRLVKIDVESFELEVFKGATHLLSQGNAKYLVEIIGKKRKESILSYLKENDLKVNITQLGTDDYLITT